MKPLVRCKNAVAGLAFVLALALLSPLVAAGSLQPAEPQPAPDALQPGLAVDYYFVKLDKLDQLYGWLGNMKPEHGAPLANIDFVAGEEGPVLNSEKGSLIAAIITGYVKFPESGEYQVLALVNDGMRLWIGAGDNDPILEDPRKLADRLVGPATVTVEAGKWYPLKLEYFQKKGTSALVLAWMRPGAQEGEEEVIEPEFFAHLPE
jgi:hypothetical protein